MAAAVDANEGVTKGARDAVVAVADGVTKGTGGAAEDAPICAGGDAGAVEAAGGARLRFALLATLAAGGARMRSSNSAVAPSG